MPSLQGVLESSLEAVFAQIARDLQADGARFRVDRVQDGLTVRVLFTNYRQSLTKYFLVLRPGLCNIVAI